MLAVNGLRDQALCRELISVTDLKWDTLGDLLRSKTTADASVSMSSEVQVLVL